APTTPQGQGIVTFN
nr:fimbrial antigen F165 subunit 1, fimbrial antigen F165(1) {N-terminal} [Escherichia coli, 4787, porcine wild-type (O115:K-:H51:F165), Peptide Partial, 14 aa] [Escherichia coli]